MFVCLGCKLEDKKVLHRMSASIPRLQSSRNFR